MPQDKPLSFAQRMVFAFASPAVRDEMREESERWVLTCPGCGHQRSVWELGGVRYRAYSRGKYQYGRCNQCNKRAWMPMTLLDPGRLPNMAD